MRISPTRRERFATAALYALIALLIAGLAWHGEAGPFWGQVDLEDSPLYRERIDQALREMAD